MSKSMPADNTDATQTADLTALSAAAQGRPKPSSASTVAHLTAVEEARRAAKVTELKASFEAGTLTVDESALAAKLIDAHLEKDPPSFENPSGPAGQP